MVHSPFYHLPKHVRNNRLQDGRTSVTIQKQSLRAASCLHDVPYATLRRYILSDGNVSVQGLRPCPEPAEEQIITDVALGFCQERNTAFKRMSKGLDAAFYPTPSVTATNETPFSRLPPG